MDLIEDCDDDLLVLAGLLTCAHPEGGLEDIEQGQDPTSW
jgi:hypothetical protein